MSEPIDDPAADLEVLRAGALVPPALQRARAQPPAPRELHLVEVLDRHRSPRRAVDEARMAKVAGGCRGERRGISENSSSKNQLLRESVGWIGVGWVRMRRQGGTDHSGFRRSWYRPRPSDLITRRHSFCDLKTSDMRIDVAPASDNRDFPSHQGCRRARHGARGRHSPAPRPRSVRGFRSGRPGSHRNARTCRPIPGASPCCSPRRGPAPLAGPPTCRADNQNWHEQYSCRPWHRYPSYFRDQGPASPALADTRESPLRIRLRFNHQRDRYNRPLNGTRQTYPRPAEQCTFPAEPEYSKADSPNCFCISRTNFGYLTYWQDGYFVYDFRDTKEVKKRNYLTDKKTPQEREDRQEVLQAIRR